MNLPQTFELAVTEYLYLDLVTSRWLGLQ